MEHYLQQELYNLIKTDSSIFRFIQTGSLDGLWYWDLENPEEEWMSEKFWTELGYDPTTKLHKSSAWQGIINQQDLGLAMKEFDKHCADPDYPYDQVVRYTHKNGSTVYIRCRGLAIRNAAGKPIRMLGAHNNITSIMEATAKLKGANQMLEKKNRELEEFSYIASHDLQEPMNTVKGFVEILLEDYEDTLEEEAVEFLNTISDSIDRMKKLVKSLLDYSRLGATKTLGLVDCNELIQQTLKDLDSKIKDNKATITVENLPTLEGYETELRLLFQNLIGNAIKFQKSNNKPEIAIGVQKENGWTFSIKDNGIGISERNRERIFSIFQQLNPNTEFEGTGIGLAHCKKVAAMHDGDIWVKSELGKGSTFYFNINL